MTGTVEADTALQELAARLTAAFGPTRVRRAVMLAPFTTFRIGGPADLFFEARTLDELAFAIGAARACGGAYFLLGLGANILIGDHGFRGLVIRNGADQVTVDAPRREVRAASGAVMGPQVIETAVAHGLSGLEHYVGIPSTVGGALWQNLHFLSPPPARSRTCFIAEVVSGAVILDGSGNRREVDVDYFRFGYDDSVLQHCDDVVLSALFRLAPGDVGTMRAIMRANLAWREQRHPPLDTEPSAGSIFRKIEGVGAGRLIEQCGLKGFRVGTAEISERHANIIINRGGATAADVRAVIAHTQAVVERETGERLMPEITFVGDF